MTVLKCSIAPRGKWFICISLQQFNLPNSTGNWCRKLSTREVCYSLDSLKSTHSSGLRHLLTISHLGCVIHLCNSYARTILLLQYQSGGLTKLLDPICKFFSAVLLLRWQIIYKVLSSCLDQGYSICVTISALVTSWSAYNFGIYIQPALSTNLASIGLQ